MPSRDWVPGVCLLTLRSRANFFRPSGAWSPFPARPHGSRRGLHSFAAPRLRPEPLLRLRSSTVESLTSHAAPGLGRLSRRAPTARAVGCISFAAPRLRPEPLLRLRSSTVESLTSHAPPGLGRLSRRAPTARAVGCISFAAPRLRSEPLLRLRSSTVESLTSQMQDVGHAGGKGPTSQMQDVGTPVQSRNKIPAEW